MTRTIVLYSRSRLQTDILGSVLSSGANERNILRWAKDINDVLQPLTSFSSTLVVLDGDSMNGEWQRLIHMLDQRGNNVLPLLVLIRERKTVLLRRLQKHGLCGAFDMLVDGLDDLKVAIERTSAGQIFWSTSLVHHLLREISIERSEKSQLTPSEDNVMAVIVTGLDDKSASNILGLSVSTIASIRKAIHKKLRVQHRSDLIKSAISRGYGDIIVSDALMCNTRDRPNCDRMDEV